MPSLWFLAIITERARSATANRPETQQMMPAVEPIQEVSAAGQASINYALTYTPGVLTVKPTEARQAAVASVIAAANVAPSQGNMVQADVVAKGETVTSKEDAVQVAAERGQPQQGSTPVVLTTASVNSNVLPGLRLSVVDTGLRLPVAAGNTSIESQ